MAASPSEALVRGRATYQDVLDAPAHQVAEIVDGTLHTRPRPAPAHGEASSNLGFELGPPFGRGRGGPGGWRFTLEVEDLRALSLEASAYTGARLAGTDTSLEVESHCSFWKWVCVP